MAGKKGTRKSEDILTQEIIEALDANDGYVKRAAEDLGIDRGTFANVMKKRGIEKRRKRGEKPTIEWRCKAEFNFEYAREFWYRINKRCHNENDQDYKYYGNRGITVCDEWRFDLDKFYYDLYELPNAFIAGYSIDRIDNDKGYCKENVRFVDRKVQANNTSRNRMLKLDGEEKTLAQWADEYGISQGRLKDRLNWGWDLRTALTAKKYKRYKKSY